MDIYATEEQQWEAIKKWFYKYGNMLSWALIAVLALVMAVQYWSHHRTVVREQASEHYISLMMGFEKNEPATVSSKTDVLVEQYPKSIYTSLANLYAATQAASANDLEQTQKRLEWVLNNGTDDLKPIARLRLMRLWISQSKFKEALQLTEGTKTGDFEGLMNELKGDILLKQANRAGAKDAYEKALALAPEEGMVGPLLKMKIQELGGQIPEKNEKNKNEENKEVEKS